MLAVFYMGGIGVAKNTEKGRKLLLLSAERGGYPWPLCGLASLYGHSHPERAAELYRLDSDRGGEDGWYELAKLHMEELS